MSQLLSGGDQWRQREGGCQIVSPQSEWGASAHCSRVAQTFKSAVSRVSKPAGVPTSRNAPAWRTRPKLRCPCRFRNRRYSRFGNLRYGSSARLRPSERGLPARPTRGNNVSGSIVSGVEWSIYLSHCNSACWNRRNVLIGYLSLPGSLLPQQEHLVSPNGAELYQPRAKRSAALGWYGAAPLGLNTHRREVTEMLPMNRTARTFASIASDLVTRLDSTAPGWLRRGPAGSRRSDR